MPFWITHSTSYVMLYGVPRVVFHIASHVVLDGELHVVLHVSHVVSLHVACAPECGASCCIACFSCCISLHVACASACGASCMYYGMCHKCYHMACVSVASCTVLIWPMGTSSS